MLQMTVQEVSPHIPLSKRAGGFMDRGSSSRMKTYGRNKLDECAGCLVRFVECLPLVCRIIHAPIPYQSKHPVILRKKYEIVSLIVTQLHQNMNHSGPQHVLSELRQRYWVSQVRSVIKKKLSLAVSARNTVPNQLLPWWQVYLRVDFNHFPHSSTKLAWTILARC